MKKITTTLLSLFMATGLLSANDYTPLVREGVKWKCSMAVCYELNHENDLYQYTIELKGDTTINNIRYKKCYYTFVNNGIATDDIPKAFLREDIAEKKVYVLLNKDYKVNVAYTPVPYDTDSGEKLLYDFNDWTNPELCWNTSNIINSVTTEKISYNGKEYTKTVLNGEYVVVDGIGFAKNEITWVGYDLLHPYVDRPSDGSSFIGSLSCLDFFIDETGTNIDMFDMLGIDELKQDDKSVLIELIKGSINISSIEEIKSVRIINMAGMVIDVVSPNVNTITIPTDKYPSGCYIIQVATENNIATKKIIL